MFRFDYFHKIQSGGQGQYGRVTGICEPLPPQLNTQLLFQDDCVGTNIPKQFMPAIEKGFREVAEKGPLIGQKVAGIRIRLQDGASHSVDSTEIAFIFAGRYAMQDGNK